MSLLSEIGHGETQLADNDQILNDGKILLIQNQPIMECALDVLTNLGTFGKVTLKAKDDAIPSAVAVANIITENMLKGNSKIDNIKVDSENGTGKYGMTLISTISIIISKIN